MPKLKCCELENREADDQEGVSVMPGAVELVRSIPQGRWGVVTSGTRLLASARLRFCGLPIPEVLVTADEVSNGKPHPEPYLKGAERLGFEPEECLVIEDAPAGIQAATSGGHESDWHREHVCREIPAASRRRDRETGCDSRLVEWDGETDRQPTIAVYSSVNAAIRNRGVGLNYSTLPTATAQDRSALPRCDPAD